MTTLNVDITASFHRLKGRKIPSKNNTDVSTVLDRAGRHGVISVSETWNIGPSADAATLSSAERIVLISAWTWSEKR